MMTTTTIPAGYRITTTTWENDADNYNTEILEGQTKEQVQFYVALAKLFGSSSNSEHDIGNLYEPVEAELAKVAEVSRELFAKFPAVLQEFAELKLEDLDDLNTACNTLFEMASNIGAAGSSEFYTRVVSSQKIEFIPQDIILQDVTEVFQ